MKAFIMIHIQQRLHNGHKGYLNLWLIYSQPSQIGNILMPSKIQPAVIHLQLKVSDQNITMENIRTDCNKVG